MRTGNCTFFKAKDCAEARSRGVAGMVASRTVFRHRRFVRSCGADAPALSAFGFAYGETKLRTPARAASRQSCLPSEAEVPSAPTVPRTLCPCRGRRQGRSGHGVPHEFCGTNGAMVKAEVLLIITNGLVKMCRR